MNLVLKFKLPPELVAELQTAAAQSRCTPESFAAETLEAALAARRLPSVRPGQQGPRRERFFETAVDIRPLVAEMRAGPLDSAEIPTADELSAIEDIR